MIYVLIIVSIYGGGALSTQEFTSKDRCEYARAQIHQTIGAPQQQYFRTVCVQK